MVESKGISLVTVIDGRAVTVWGDSDRLQQVFWNLVSNAVKFTHEGGHVRVVLERVGADVQVTVQDDGVGGASLVEGAGLAGLRDRVGGLDGELHLLSPQGGPTVLMVEIPCGS